MEGHNGKYRSDHIIKIHIQIQSSLILVVGSRLLSCKKQKTKESARQSNLKFCFPDDERMVSAQNRTSQNGNMSSSDIG